MKALICCGLKSLPSRLIFQSVPMWRLTERTVRSTFVTAWRLATSPTSTSPFLAKATTDGVVRAPSALGMTVGSPPSSTLTTELVVPRSMPTALAMGGSSGWSEGDRMDADHCSDGGCPCNRELERLSLNFPFVHSSGAHRRLDRPRRARR